MSDSRRLLVRKSLLAVILAYLRDGVVATDGFPAYPVEQGIYTFTLNSELWQIKISEAGQPPLAPGVTIEFVSDRAVTGKAMPQVWELAIRFRVRVPWDHDGSSTSQQIAQKIDEALYRANGKAPIRDFSADPITDAGTGLAWQTTERGEWKEEGSGLLTDLTLGMAAHYSTPNL